ncbi:MAG: ATPase [Candidatus Hydrogenedentes bacterium]|jgi:ATP-binding protein involved in chromosome partitioning|nr:ATPase [Candidatus Hydrogenedentota bacterium]
MRFAIPVAEGKLALHFGHCAQFAMVDVDDGSKHIVSTFLVDAPPHEPGLLPTWLANQDVNIIIAGGMGVRAQELLVQQGIEVVVGAPSDAPETLVRAYLDDTLQTGGNLCDH